MKFDDSDYIFEDGSDDVLQNELDMYALAAESFGLYGYQPTIVDFCARHELLSSVSFSMEVVGSTPENKEVAVTNSMKSGFGTRLRNWSAAALRKVASFAANVVDKVVSFSKSLITRIRGAGIIETAKAYPKMTIAAGLTVMGMIINLIQKIKSVMAKVFTTPENLKAAIGDITKSLKSITTPFMSVEPSVSGARVSAKVVTNTEVLKQTATAGGWTKNALTQTVQSFETGSSGIGNALKSLGGIITAAIRSGLSWLGTASKSALRFGDKHVAGGIKVLQKGSALGGIKGFVFGIACFTFVSYLIKTVLGLIKRVLNGTSDLIERQVNALCGSETA